MLPAFALAPLTLVAVLVLSGLAKLPDPRATHSMMTVLGLPGAVAHRAVARLLPWVELTVAGLLLTPWRWTFALGSLAAVGLFLAFWVVVARAMTVDPRPTCPCFGRVGDHRITWRTVVRNTILLALALLTTAVALLGESGTGLVADFGRGEWAWLLLAAMLATVAVLVLSRAPRASTSTSTSGSVSGTSPVALLDGILVGRDHEVLPLRRLVAQQPQLLVLVDCWCGSTVATINQLPHWRERLPQLGVQLVHTHAPWGEPRLADAPGVWWDPGARVYSSLGTGPSPVAALVDTEGRVAQGPVSGVESIERLVARLADNPGAADPGSAAVRAPDAP